VFEFDPVFAPQEAVYAGTADRGQDALNSQCGDGAGGAAVIAARAGGVRRPWLVVPLWHTGVDSGGLGAWDEAG
jgi:hypothetical protein